MQNDRLRRKIIDVVSSLAKFDLDIWQRVGPGVQALLFDKLEALTPEQKLADRELLLAVCSEVLSPEIEGTSWTAGAVSFRTGAIPVTSQIVSLRDRAIDVLFELFKTAQTDNERRAVYRTLREAGQIGGRVEPRDDLISLALANAARIVKFLANENDRLSYELKQTIEHDLLYDYRRARDISRAPARARSAESANYLMVEIDRLRSIFNSDPAFEKFKVLVGFESVFPQQWIAAEKEGGADDYRSVEQYRQQEADKYISAIDNSNESWWFNFIERIASIESNDMATFPPFARFLTQLAKAKPKTVARLLALPSDAAEGRFFPAILAGLQESGDSATYDNVFTRAVKAAKHLGAVARHVRLLGSHADVDMAETVLARAIEVEDNVAVAECLIATMEINSPSDVRKRKLYIPAIEYLNRRGAYWWIRAAWIARDASAFFDSLSEAEASQLIPALVYAPRVEFQVEQLLIEIAKRFPKLVWSCFEDRLRAEKPEDVDRFEPIPYEFHGLQVELSKFPTIGIISGLRMFRGNAHLFRFRGGKLLSIAFPSCLEPFAIELANLASSASKQEAEFILGVMENYHGEPTTHEVLKRLLARFPTEDGIRTGVMISLENTGVFMGEFGFVEVLRQKLNIAREWQTDTRKEVQEFARAHIESLVNRIAQEQQRAEQRKALNELRYQSSDESPEG